jgi:pimeloyl-ACP methyl ester carboxylesterase
MSESIIELQTPDGTAIKLHTSGSGETLLLIHGWTLDRRSFAAQGALAERFRIVSFDRRGFGESGAAPDLGAETGDIDAIIDALNVDSLHLLGVSQGARVALRYAAQRPQRVRSLILQGPAVDGYVPPMEDSSGIPLADYMALAARGELDELRQRWLAHPLMNSETLSSAQSASLQEMVNAYRGSDLLAGTPAASAIPDLLERLGSLDLPTLLITGERETAARQAHCARLAEVMRDVREVVLPDCGHLSNYSQPQAYNRAVDEFVGSLTARGRRP